MFRLKKTSPVMKRRCSFTIWLGLEDLAGPALAPTTVLARMQHPAQICWRPRSPTSHQLPGWHSILPQRARSTLWVECYCSWEVKYGRGIITLELVKHPRPGVKREGGAEPTFLAWERWSQKSWHPTQTKSHLPFPRWVERKKKVE